MAEKAPYAGTTERPGFDPKLPHSRQPTAKGAAKDLQLSCGTALHAGTKSQCDGCKARMKLKDGIHMGPDGKAHMACQKDRYC